MKEKLIIENFGGIKSLELDINQINILIGPQASGKSVCAKLLYFFKKFGFAIFKIIENEKSKKELDESIINKFKDYFPPDSYPKCSFNLKYLLNDCYIQIKSANGAKIELSYSDYFKKEFQSLKVQFKKFKEKQHKGKNVEFFLQPYEIREKFIRKIQEDIGKQLGFNQLFIPAGRSFFANLQRRIFSFLSESKAIDPFLIEFGSFYEGIKDFRGEIYTKNGKKNESKKNIIDDLIEKILGGNYFQEGGNDYLIHPDGRQINIAYSSSGQQETLPLAIILKSLEYLGFMGNGATIYIEEPETHIFPIAQKNIIELISYIFKAARSEFQFFITTHSPYVLSSFNNLMYAGMLENNLKNSQKEKLYKIIPKELIINPKLVNAYSLENDKCINLINPETNLIDTNIIDSVSDEISIQFDKLLNIE